MSDSEGAISHKYTNLWVGQYYCLVAFILFLPNFEAPKNLFLVLYIVISAFLFVFDRTRAGREKPSVFEVVLLASLIASVLSSAFNWPLQEGLKGLRDVFFWVTLGLFVYRSKYSQSQLKKLGYVILVSAILGIIYGYWQYVSGGTNRLEFHSVGVVTHSSIYLGMVLMLAIGFFFDYVKKSGYREILYASLFVLMLFALLFMGSRGSILAFVVTMVIAFPVFVFKQGGRKSLSWIVLMGLIMVVSLYLVPSYFSKSGFVEKTAEVINNIGTGTLSTNDAKRFELWAIAIYQVKAMDSQLVGIGPKQFPYINLDEIEYESVFIDAKKQPFKSAHAHNLFLTKLVEEGWLGMASLVLYFGIALFILIKDVVLVRINWLSYAVIGAVFMPLIAGVFNTPFRHETALLSVLLVAMYFSYRRLIFFEEKNPLSATLFK